MSIRFKPFKTRLDLSLEFTRIYLHERKSRHWRVIKFFDEKSLSHFFKYCIKIALNFLLSFSWPWKLRSLMTTFSVTSSNGPWDFIIQWQMSGWVVFRVFMFHVLPLLPSLTVLPSILKQRHKNVPSSKVACLFPSSTWESWSILMLKQKKGRRWLFTTRKLGHGQPFYSGGWEYTEGSGTKELERKQKMLSQKYFPRFPNCGLISSWKWWYLPFLTR